MVSGAAKWKFPRWSIRGRKSRLKTLYKQRPHVSISRDGLNGAVLCRVATKAFISTSLHRRPACHTRSADRVVERIRIFTASPGPMEIGKIVIALCASDSEEPPRTRRPGTVMRCSPSTVSNWIGTCLGTKGLAVRQAKLARSSR